MDSGVGGKVERVGLFVCGNPLRALAALSVLLYHVGLVALNSAHEPVPVTPVGFETAFGSLTGRTLFVAQQGLFLFFVLSGYLIARPFVRSYLSGSPAPALRSYLSNRALRIVPAFWFVVTLVLLRYGAQGASPGELAGVYLFGQNFVSDPAWTRGVLGPGWTLHCEVGFYLLVPITAAALMRLDRGRRSQRQRLLVVLGLAAVVAVCSLAARQALPAGAHLLPTNLFAFMPGIALAALEPFAATAVARGGLLRPRPLLLAAAGLLLLAIELELPLSARGLSGALIGAGAGLLVAAPLVRQWQGSGAWRLLDNGALQWVGERSYSLYLLQLPLLFALAPLLTGGVTTRALLLLAPGLALSLTAATVSWKLVEQPFLRLRLRLRPRRPQPKPAPATARA